MRSNSINPIYPLQDTDVEMIEMQEEDFLHDNNARFDPAMSSPYPAIPLEVDIEEDDDEYLSEDGYARRMLRTAQKKLTKFVERKPVVAMNMRHDGSDREAVHVLSPETPVLTPEERREYEEHAGFNDIMENMISFNIGRKSVSVRQSRPAPTPPANLPSDAEVRVKRPSRNLPPENVINRKTAFDSGAKIGTGAFVFYRGFDFFKAILGKRPFPRGGRVAYLVDLLRNECRVIYKNVETLQAKMDLLKKELYLPVNVRKQQDADELEIDGELQLAPLKETEADKERLKEYERKCVKAMLYVFFLEENLYKLHTALSNIKMYNGLLKGKATIGIMGSIVHDKTWGDEPHPFFVERDAFYEKENVLFRAMAHNSKDIIANAKDDLEHFHLSRESYETWKNDNWRAIRIRMNKYKGAGCMTGQAIQGMIISIINMGIAAGVHSPAAAAASVFYALSTGARVVQTAVRTTLENNLIREAAGLRDEATILREDSTAGVKQAHAHLATLGKVEIVVNQIEGFANSGFNVAGTLTSLPLSTGKPATISPPIESVSAPVLGSVSIFSSHNSHSTVGSHRRTMRR